MREKVVIVGGGIAGLTAAHELIDRGFEVHLYERKSRVGGKAASAWQPSGAGGSGSVGELPTEHGFRFFAGWYRHLPDTLKRIPYKGKRAEYEGKKVFDNLVPARMNLVLWFNRAPAPLALHLPRSLDEAAVAGTLMHRLDGLGLSPGELRIFASKLMVFLAGPNDAETRKLAAISWWDYLECSTKSPAFQALVRGTTRTSIAAKAEEVSALTLGRMAVRTMFDLATDVDRVLNGPTSDVWITPWVEYLASRGVVFHLGRDLESLRCVEEDVPAAGKPRRSRKNIHSLRFSSIPHSYVGKLREIATRLVLNLASPQSPGEPAKGTLDCLLKCLELLETVNDELKAGALETDPDHPEALEKVAGKASEVHASVQRALYSAELIDFQRALLEAIKRCDDSSPKLTAVGAAIQDLLDALPAHPWEPNQEEWIEDCRRTMLPLLLALEAASDVKATSLIALLTPLLGQYHRDKTGKVAPLVTAWEGWLKKVDAQLAELAALLGGLVEATPPVETVEADFFVLALPLEQAAYYVNRSTMLTYHDASLRRLVTLAGSLDWMSGIQFYLRRPVATTRGHMISLDSEWALTAVEQTQFWTDVGRLPSGVKAVLSVDVSEWNRKGRFLGKEAFNCSDDEIAFEVWEQLKSSFTQEDRPAELQDDLLVGGGLVRHVSYHLDDSVIDRFDRKKQAAYERSRGARFDEGLEDIAAGLDVDNEGDERSTPLVWGARLRLNTEPLLVNRVGTDALRPTVTTALRNLFLCGDYVRTSTDLACMESANESGRRAVNAILEAAGSESPRCELWSFLPADLATEALRELANPTAMVRAGAKGLHRVLSSWSTRLVEGAGRVALDLQSKLKESDNHEV